MAAAPLPLTYVDLLCDLDLDLNAAETTSDLENLIQDVGHILVQDLGSNLDDPNRGVGIYRYLSGTTADLQKISKLIEAQLGDDDRITAVSASVEASPLADFTYLLKIQLQVSGAVLGLEYGFSNSTGLSLLSSTTS